MKLVRTLATLLALMIQTACAWHGALRENFYSPSESSSKLPFSVAIFEGEKAVPGDLEFKNVPNNVKIHIKLNPGFANAIKTGLAGVFDAVKEISSREQAKDQDYLAIGVVNATQLAIFFLDPQTQELISEFHRPFEVGMLPAFPSAASVLLQDITLFAAKPIVNASVGNRTIDKLQQGIGQALVKITQDIRENQTLREYPGRKAKSQEFELSGDLRLKEGEKLKALAFYAAALRNTYFGTQLDSRVRRKFLKLGSELAPDLPQIPREARRHNHRAAQLFKEAEGEADSLQQAASEIRRALQLAPWWSDAYYNLGLVYEAMENDRGALLSYQFCLLSFPNGSNAVDARDKVAVLQAKKR